MISEEQAVAALVASGIRSFTRADFFSLPVDQQAALLEEDALEAKSRPTTPGDVAALVLAVALKVVSGGAAIESAVGLVTGVPELVNAAEKL